MDGARRARRAESGGIGQGRVLVTGAGGFIGAHLTKRLVTSGAEVCALVRPAMNPWRLGAIAEKMHFIEADLGAPDWPSRLAAAGQFSHLVHLAAAGVAGAEESSHDVMNANIMGTLRLLEWLRAQDGCRSVMCGSCFEYPPGKRLSENTALRPNSVYGVSKASTVMLACLFARQYDLPVTALRFFTVYGPLEARRRLVPHTILSLLDGRPLNLTSGEQRRDFVFVEDAVDAILAAADEPAAAGEVFNICTGEDVSIREIVRTLVAITATETAPDFGALAPRGGEYTVLSGDPAKAARILGWRASTALQTGLERTVEWFLRNRGDYPEYCRSE